MNSSIFLLLKFLQKKILLCDNKSEEISAYLPYFAPSAKPFLYKKNKVSLCIQTACGLRKALKLGT